MISSEDMNGIRESAVFLVLGTINYLEGLRKADTRIVGQITAARMLEKPAFLMLESSLTEKEAGELREYFKGFKTVDEEQFDAGDEKGMEKAVLRLKEVLAR